MEKPIIITNFYRLYLRDMKRKCIYRCFHEKRVKRIYLDGKLKDSPVFYILLIACKSKEQLKQTNKAKLVAHFTFLTFTFILFVAQMRKKKLPEFFHFVIRTQS
jgi:hypothetical protein